MLAMERRAHPDEKEGTKYIVIRDTDDFDKGTIVELVDNDESMCPYFSTIGSKKLSMSIGKSLVDYLLVL